MHEIQLPRILICDQIHDAGLAMLQENVAVDVVPNLNKAELIHQLPRYDGLIVRGNEITFEILEHAFRLKIIGNALPYLDGIDVAFAKGKGVEVVYAPDANTLAVAEHTIKFHHYYGQC